MKRRKPGTDDGRSGGAVGARRPERIVYAGEAESGPSLWAGGREDQPLGVAPIVDEALAGSDRHYGDVHRPATHSLPPTRHNTPLFASLELLSPLLAVCLLPLAVAAPAPPPIPRFYRPHPTPRAGIDQSSVDDSASAVKYITTAVLPNTLPTSVNTVAETKLPYYLTQDALGNWHKVDGAWNLYGRRAADPSHSSASASATQTFQVEDALPPGWGQVSERTSFYRVPLIAAASVILAVILTVIIVFAVLHRRKSHRKAKRRAERRRRKALAAAGITEGAAPGSAQELAFKEKLAELEKQHRAKKQKGAGTTFVKSKVRRWNASVGLRRRKGKGDGTGSPNGGLGEILEEEKVADAPAQQPTLAVRRDSAGSMASQQSRERSSGEASGSTTAVNDLSPGSGESTGSTTGSAPAETANSGPPAPAQPGAPSFPPAYRPASVRSVRLGTAAASSSSRPAQAVTEPDHELDPPVLDAQDKVRAPGYYPAPATEESEAAIAVASRRDGKRRMPDPEEVADGDQQARTRHIATDDKRVLEQMRMGASEPPAAPPLLAAPVTIDGQGESGPSAPIVEVDEAGFERFDPAAELAPASPAAVPPRLHPDLPLPPAATRHRLFTTPSSEPSDEAHLLPSAPPSAFTSAPSAPGLSEADGSAAAPSAPIFDMGEDEGDLYEELTPVSAAPGMAVPTSRAPPVPHDEELEDVEEHPVEVEGDDRRLEELTGGQVPVQPRLLPRYEP